MRQTRDEAGGQRIAARCHNDRNLAGCLLGCDRCRRSSRDDHVNLEPEQFFREARESLWPTVSRAILHDDVLSLRISELLEPLPECLQVGGVRCSRYDFQQTDTIDLSRRLRLHGDRRGEEPTSERAKERPPFHYSITSSARASSDGGTVRPSALAVLRLMTNRNVVACWIGISLGLAPRRTLSTMSAAFRTASSRLYPYVMRPPHAAKELTSEMVGSRNFKARSTNVLR